MTQTDLQDIGKVIRQNRQARRLSQNDLARLSGVSRPRITRLETGRITDITVGNLLRLLRALDLELRVTQQNRQRPTLEELREEDERA
jgi:transcriptional regulator with XRE-family HTH domain